MKRMILFLSLLGAIIIILWSCSDDSSTDPEPTLSEKFQEALDDGLASFNGKGVSAAVIMPDGFKWVGVSGISHGTTKITKEMASSYPYIDSTITIRQLLNHTSGISDFVDNHDCWVALFEDPSKVWTVDEIIQTYQQESLFPKGTDWNYSSSGYLLLRKIIMDITESDIVTVNEERFWEPFNLTHSFTLQGESVFPMTVAHGWWDLDSDGAYDDFYSWPRAGFSSAACGEVWSTAEDLAEWAKALFLDKTVLSQSYLDQMLDFHSPCTGEEDMCAGYGLGAVLFNPQLFNGITAYGHSGNAPGYAAASIYLPDYGVCIGLMDNTEEGESVAMSLINIINVITEEVEDIP
ncbi:MAG: serine hydrolase [Calditrichaceae bacterium]